MSTELRRREEYEIEFTDEDRLRVRFDRTGRTVTYFSVQYLALIETEWQPVVRMDTAHGRAHMDVSRPDGTQIASDLEVQDYNAALTWSIGEIKRQWAVFRRRYERWMR